MGESRESGWRAKWPAELRRALGKYFSKDEIKILCFDLQVDYDNLPGEVRSIKIAALIDDLARNSKIFELIDLCSSHRPDGPWESFLVEAVKDPFFGEFQLESSESSPPEAGSSSSNIAKATVSKIAALVVIFVIFLAVVIVLLLALNAILNTPDVSSTVTALGVVPDTTTTPTPAPTEIPLQTDTPVPVRISKWCDDFNEAHIDESKWALHTDDESLIYIQNGRCVSGNFSKPVS